MSDALAAAGSALAGEGRETQKCPPSKHFDSGRLIVARPARQHYVGSASVFADDRWNLLPGIGQESISPAEGRVDFGGLFADPIWRLTAKEFLMASLSYGIPGEARFTPIKYTSASAELYSFRRFANFIRLAGAERLSMVTPAMLAAYVLEVSSHGYGVPHQVRTLRIVKKLWSYRHYLSYDGLPAEPWPGKKAVQLTGAKQIRGENLTPRIPEEVMGPTLRWAIRYVDDFSAEIIDTVQSLRARSARAPLLRLNGMREQSTFRTRLERWISQRRAEGSGIPRLPQGSRALAKVMRKPEREADPVYLANRSRIEQEAGLPSRSFGENCPTFQAQLRIAIQELGWEQPGREDGPSVFRLLGGEDGHVVIQEYRHLLTACYIVIAYLSGMRDCEVHSIRVGGCYTRPTRDGLRLRHVLRGRVYKNAVDEGQQEEWVITEPVSRAVRVLEHIAAVEGRSERGSPLFTLLAHARKGKNDYIKTSMPRYLGLFRDHANRLASLASDAEQYPPIPPHEGKPWHFQTRMFRRTLAWYIANRPFGIVAGALQFKHVGISTFEGYAGSSKSNFRAEVEAENILRRITDLTDNYQRACRGEVFAGGGGGRIKAEMLRVAEEMGDFPGKVVDEPRLRALLVHRFHTLVPGVLNDCAFAPAHALCLAGVPEEERSSPLVRLCNPIACTNSSLTRRHLPLVQLAYDNADRALKTRGITPNQAKVIRSERDRYARLRDNLLGD